jgi:predicted  nucleic acid-binding Zn-ribbon protein
MQWVCEICGYVHDDEEAPELCPVCGAPRGKFSEHYDDADEEVEEGYKEEEEDLDDDFFRGYDE